MNANADFLDAVSSIGRLLVTPAEVPSGSLHVRVTAGPYVKADGAVNAFPGVEGYGLPASSATALWLTDEGTLSASSDFPTTPHVRLATVLTGPTCIQSIIDERVGFRTCCSNSANPLSSTASVINVGPDGASIGFLGAPPATQSPALAPLVDLSTGAASGSIADVGPTYSQALVADNFATLAAKVNAVIAALKRHGLMAS